MGIAYTEETRVRAVRFFEENGYFFASSPAQKEYADSMVKEGHWREVTPEMTNGSFSGDNFYVHSSVNSRLKMPWALKHLVATPEPFRKREILELWIVSIHASTYVKFMQQLNETRAEVEMLGTHTIAYVDMKDLSRTGHA